MGKRIPMWAVLMTIGFAILAFLYGNNTFGAIGLTCSYGTDIHLPLIVSVIFASAVAKSYGWKWAVIEKGMMDAIMRPMQAMLILLTVGMMISGWIAGGVVPSMIYYGLKFLSPKFFLVTSCILSLIVTLATGSSWTTVGTIGLALIGMGEALGVPMGMTAGAAICGAYCGDKMSPLSDTTLMAPAVSGCSVFDHIRAMMWTTVPGFIISCILFLFLGFRVEAAATSGEVVSMQQALLDNFRISPILLLPPVIVIFIVVFKTPALPGMFLGLGLGCVLGSVYQHVPVGDWFTILHYGFHFKDVAGIDPFIVKLLQRGGMSSMLWTFNLVVCVMCFAGILDSTGMMKTITDWLLSRAKGEGMLFLCTVSTCILVNVILCSQFTSILLTGRMYKRAFEDARLKPQMLSRTLEDTGTMTSPLVPWGSCGVTLYALMGVPTLVYMPYCFLCFISPITALIYGFTGFRTLRMTDEEYAKVLEERKKEDEENCAAAEALA